MHWLSRAVRSLSRNHGVHSSKKLKLRTRRPQLEQLERRELLSISGATMTDFVGPTLAADVGWNDTDADQTEVGGLALASASSDDWTKVEDVDWCSSAGPLGRRLNFGPFVKGQKVRIELDYTSGEGGPLSDGWFVRCNNHEKTLEDASDSDTISFTASAGSVYSLWAYFEGGPDPNDWLNVKVYKEKLTNLTAPPVKISAASGTVGYGYDIHDREARYGGRTYSKLYYAGDSGNLISEADSILLPTPGKPDKPVYKYISANQFIDGNGYSKVPSNATHLVTIVDPTGATPESNEDDNDNRSVLVAIPNVAIDDLRIENGTIYCDYSVTDANGAVKGKSDLRIYGIDADGNRRQLKREDIDTGGKVSRSVMVTPSSDELKGIVSLAAVFDEDQRLLERHKGDNSCEIDVPNSRLRIAKIDWTSRARDGVTVKYEIEQGFWPSNTDTKLCFYWVRSRRTNLHPRKANIKISVDMSTDTRTVSIDAPRLGQTWTPDEGSFLKVRLEAVVGGDAKRSNAKALQMTNERLSAELDHLVPEGAPAKIRLAYWLSHNSTLIKQAAKKFRVSAKAIAGAIAYEALKNKVSTSPQPLNLAKIDPNSFDVMAVETTKYKRTVNPNLPSDPVAALAARTAYLKTPQGAIEYIAAIMNAYAEEARKSGKMRKGKVRNNPTALVSLYSGVLKNGRQSGVGVEHVDTSSLSHIEHKAVGYVDLPRDTRNGSAFLISPRYVLTAAHVARYYDGSEWELMRSYNWPEAEVAITYDVGIGKMAAASGVRSLHPGYLDDPSTRDRDEGSGDPRNVDLAIGRLQNAIGGVQPLELSVVGPEIMGKTVGFTGYPEYFFGGVYMPQESGENTVVYAENNQLYWGFADPDDRTADNDTYGGQSGGPVFLPGSSTKVCAVVSGGYDGEAGPRRLRDGKLYGAFSFATMITPSNYRWIRTRIGRDVQSTGIIDLGSAPLYFEYLNSKFKNKASKRVKPQADIAKWVKDNLDYLKASLQAPKTATTSKARLVSIPGDINNDFEIDANDEPALRKAIAHWGSYTDEAEIASMLECGDLNGNQTLDDNDVAMLQALIEHQGDEYDPVALDDQVSTEVGKAVSVPVLANDFSPFGSELNIVHVDTPTYGSVSFDPASQSDTLLYTPNADFRGTEQFSYYIEDSNGTCTTATVTVVVGAENPDTSKPANPTDLVADNVWTTKVDLKWQASSSKNVDSYTVSRSTNGVDWDRCGKVDASRTSIRVTNLSPDTRYFFRVKASNEYGTSGPSERLELRTRKAVPNAPANLHTTDVWPTKVDLRWNAVSGNVDNYRVSKSSDGVNWDQCGTVDAYTTKLRVTGLEPGAAYYFRVKAVNENGASEPSDSLPVTMPIVQPPTNLRKVQIWRYEVQLEWTASANANSYRVSQSRDGVNWDQSPNGTTEGTSIRIQGLSANTAYYFRVKSINNGHASVASNVLAVHTKPEEPDTPQNLRSTDQWPTKIQLRWDSADRAESYRVSKSTDGVNWDQCGTVDHPTTDLRVTGLTPGTDYHFRVKGVNSKGASAPSPSLLVATPVVQPPTGLDKDGVWKYEVQLMWNASPNADSYRVSQSRDGVNWNQSPNGTTTGTSIRIKSLLPNTTYYFRVKALNNGHASVASNVLEIHTRKEEPAKPGNLHATDIWPTKVGLAWNSAARATSYRVGMKTDTTDWRPYDTVTAPTTKLRVTELTPGVKYHFRVIALNSRRVVRTVRHAYRHDANDSTADGLEKGPDLALRSPTRMDSFPECEFLSCQSKS